MNKKENEELRFLSDVANHEMIIIRDDGVNRHIRFKRPGTSCMHFDLITWPGYLCYTGDMGTYVFCRLEDMFEFFRTDRNDYNHNKNGLSINPGYWGEKLEAVDKDSGFKQYSHEKFHSIVNETVEDHIINNELSDDDAQTLRDAVALEVLTIDDTEHDAHQALRDFDHHNGFTFSDSWEWDLKDYSYRFMWCCYALAWGVQKYDEAKEVKEAA